MSGNEVVNDIEVCLVSLRRSGHHAILNWIAEQLPGPAFHLNNLTIGENPFTTARNRLERSGRLDEVGPFAAEERGSLTPKKLLLVVLDGYYSGQWHEWEVWNLPHGDETAEELRNAKALEILNDPEHSRHAALVDLLDEASAAAKAEGGAA